MKSSNKWDQDRRMSEICCQSKGDKLFFTFSSSVIITTYLWIRVNKCKCWCYFLYQRIFCFLVKGQKKPAIKHQYENLKGFSKFFSSSAADDKIESWLARRQLSLNDFRFLRLHSLTLCHLSENVFKFAATRGQGHWATLQTQARTYFYCKYDFVCMLVLTRLLYILITSCASSVEILMCTIKRLSCQVHLQQRWVVLRFSAFLQAVTAPSKLCDRWCTRADKFNPKDSKLSLGSKKELFEVFMFTAVAASGLRFNPIHQHNECLPSNIHYFAKYFLLRPIDKETALIDSCAAQRLHTDHNV